METVESSVDDDNPIGLDNKVGCIKHLDKPLKQSTTVCSLKDDLLPSQHEKSVDVVGSSIDVLSSPLPIDHDSHSEAKPNIKDKPNTSVNTLYSEMGGGDLEDLNNGIVDSSDYSHQTNLQENATESNEDKPRDISEFVEVKLDKSCDLDQDNGDSNKLNNEPSGKRVNSDRLEDKSSASTESTYDSNNQNDSTNTSIYKESNNDIKSVSTSMESAFKKLASLGVIAKEKPTATVESKESVLQKLASRGAISITAAGGLSLPSSHNKTVTITPSQTGPKSPMKKQQAKKIKIDPGKSMDIDKDFSSLINILSTGAESHSNQSPEAALQKKHDNNSDMATGKCLDEINVEVNKNLSPEQNISNDRMDVDVVEDHSVHESDSESHDGNKSVSQGSDQAEEESLVVTSYKLKNVIEEGSAEILLSAKKNVFYNKVQEFNRDMSIAALTVFSEMHQQDPRTRNRGKKRKAAEDIADDSQKVDENIFEPGLKSEYGITILEALSATGLRSIRYAREIPGVKEVTANDLSEDAVETIRRNIEHNGVEDMVSTTMSDASLLMYQQQTSQQWYDAIDLDPYGCPSRFLDSAVQAVRDGGLLLVTCTDMAVLAGNSPETCYVKYGAVSLRSPACHEMALRIALQCIESHANRYGRYIVPLVSFSADFYIRLIVQIYTSPVTCKRTTCKLSMVYQCVGCQTHTLQPLGHMSQAGANSQPKFSLPPGPPVDANCFQCNFKHTIGGPIWSAPMYSSKFVESMLRVVETGKFATSKRMQGMLEVIREELPDVPLYYTIAGLCTRLHCQAIPLIDIRSALLNTGYKVSSSHAAPTAIKTNAPAKIIWDIMRCWVHMNPVSQKRLVPGSVPAAIILVPPTLIANFDIHPKARPSSSMRKLLRYQPNPEKNWGPGMRAKCNVSDESAGDKSKLNQNKNKAKNGNKNIDIIEVVTIDDEDEIIEDTSAMETPAAVSSSFS